MSEPFVSNHKSSSLADVADISLADLHNVIHIKEASRVRNLTLDPTTDSLVCNCCSMSAVETN